MALWQDHRYYILDVIRRKVEFIDLCRLVAGAYRKWTPQRVVVDSASSGIPLVQTMQQRTGIPITLIPAIGSKYARADAISFLFEQGQVRPTNRTGSRSSSTSAPGFGKGAPNDDMVDAAT